MFSLNPEQARNSKREKLGDPLTLLNKAIDFRRLAQAVDAKLVIGDTGRDGRPP